MNPIVPAIRRARVALSVLLSLSVLLLLLQALDRTHDAQARSLARPAATLDVCDSCAYNTIQDAVNAAADGDLIRVAGGVYTGTMSDYSLETASYVTATVVLTKNLVVLGGFDPEAFFVRAPSVFTTTILGDPSAPRPVIAFINGTTATVDGFWLTGSSQNALGGGVFMAGAAPTLSNNRVYSNHVTSGGGGIYVGDHTTPTISGNVVVLNSADGGGGGLFVTGTSTIASLFDNQVLTNTTPGGDGGGIMVTGGATAVISGNLVAANLAPYGSGGGVGAANGASATLSGNSIVSNSGTFGGGVSARSASAVTLTANSIGFNQTPQGSGAGVGVDGAAAYLDSNTLSANTALYYGGALYACCAAGVVITGNTVLTNTALRGGAFILLAPATVVNNLIESNHTVTSGDAGGIYISAMNVVLTSNQILSNTAPQASGVELAAGAQLTASQNTIAYNTTTNGSGAGVSLAPGSSSYLADNAINSNAASSNGGGIFACCGLTTVISGNTISANTALYGAGIGVAGSGTTALITGNLIRANNTLSGGTAGGLEISSQSAVTLRANRIFSNTSEGPGGLWAHGGAVVTIENNQIAWNFGGINGGGISIEGATAIVMSNSVNANTADSGAGLFVANGANIVIDSNTVIGNRAVRLPAGFGNGGGIEILNSPSGVSLTNNIFARNEVTGAMPLGAGPGVFSYQSSPAIVNNTIALNGNAALTSSIGMWFNGATTGTTLIRNNIVYGHYYGIYYALTDTLPIVDHNDVYSTVSFTYVRIMPGAGAITATPRFADENADNYHLLPGSAAVNAGSNAAAPNHDHDGVPRPQQLIVDMGAFELQVFRTILPLIRR